jgi:hypothetical protein
MGMRGQNEFNLYHGHQVQETVGVLYLIQRSSDLGYSDGRSFTGAWIETSVKGPSRGGSMRTSLAVATTETGRVR